MRLPRAFYLGAYLHGDLCQLDGWILWKKLDNSQC
jgi:hypothetical protein